mgnify:CR=1 FL=1
MNQFVIEGKLSTKSLEKIKVILEEENVNIKEVSKDEVIQTFSKDEKERRDQLEEEIGNIVINEVNKIAQEFMEDHAISYKKEGEEIPSYFRIELGSEYDDQNYYPVINDVQFFDEEKDFIADIEVEEDRGWDIEELSAGEALASRFAEKVSVLEVEKYLVDEIIKIKKGS